MTEDEVFTHFATVAEEGGLPLVIYDNPATTHFTFTPALIGRLARLPGVRAAKCPGPAPEAAGATVAGLRAAVPEGFPLGFSGDWNATEALIAGGVAWYGVAAGLFPEPCLSIVRAIQSGDVEEARRIDRRMAPLWALFKVHSSLRIVAGLAEDLGIARTVLPRPILPLPEPVRAQALATVREMGLA